VRTDEDNTLVVLHARSMLNRRTHSPMRADNRTIILLYPVMPLTLQII